MLVRRLFALALLPLALSCGNPDNIVQGGISATTTQPVAVFKDIKSAESGVTYLSDANGKHLAQVSVVAISDHPNLCDQLKAHPTDYFRNPPEGYVAILLFAPIDKIGTFVVGRPGDEGTFSEVIATNGPPGTSQPYFATNGQMNLNNFDITSGGFGRGNFDMIIADGAGFGHEFFGRFRTHVCTGFENQLLP